MPWISWSELRWISRNHSKKRDVILVGTRKFSFGPRAKYQICGRFWWCWKWGKIFTVKIIEINDRSRKRPFLNDKQLNRKPYWQNFRFPGHEPDDLAQIVLLENLLQNSSTFVSNFPFEGQKVDRFTGKVIHANFMGTFSVFVRSRSETAWALYASCRLQINEIDLYFRLAFKNFVCRSLSCLFCWYILMHS